METKKEIAKKLCIEMGIEWDDNATVPTVAGKPIKDEDLNKLFRGDYIMEVSELEDNLTLLQSKTHDLRKQYCKIYAREERYCRDTDKICINNNINPKTCPMKMMTLEYQETCALCLSYWLEIKE